MRALPAAFQPTWPLITSFLTDKEITEKTEQHVEPMFDYNHESRPNEGDEVL